MNILAIDPSLTSTGWASLSEEGEDYGRISPQELRGFERLSYIRDSVENLLDTFQPELVVYEGYSMGRFLGKAWDRIELGGVLKFMIWSRNIRLLVVPPTSLKLFLTGSGKAEKDDMKREASRIYGRLIKNADEADAYGLLQMGKALCDRRLLPRDRRHYKHRALSGCEMM